ncbi:MAG: hypothetical protein EXR99_02085 [Gemmataceae bacterium]|nr:hypothetical protein [Gemmataceae bacterium]
MSSQGEFWKKVSPNHESLVSFFLSAAAHILILGVIALFTWEGLRRAVIGNANRRLGVSTVQLEGGSPSGKSAKATEEDVVVNPSEGKKKDNKDDPLEPPPKLDKANLPNPKVKDKGEMKASLQEDFSNQAQALAKLNQGIRKKLFDGVGKGSGSGVGPGGARDQRMVRWVLALNKVNGSDYLAQLLDLGARLGIQDPERNGKFLVLSDLTRRPAVWSDLDLEKTNEIFWIDDKTRSVGDLAFALGMKIAPPFFVVFLPIGTEEKLARLELQALQGRKEEDIFETRFTIQKTGNKYEPAEAVIKFKK